MNMPTLPSWMRSSSETIKHTFDDFNDFVAACNLHGGEQSGHPGCNINNYHFDLRSPEDKDDDPAEAKAWIREQKESSATYNSAETKTGVCILEGCNRAALYDQRQIDAYTIPTGACHFADYPECSACGKCFSEAVCGDD